MSDDMTSTPIDPTPTGVTPTDSTSTDNTATPTAPTPQPTARARSPWWRRTLFIALCLAVVVAGVNVVVQAANLAAPPVASDLTAALPFAPSSAQATLAAQVELPSSYLLPVPLGQLGPRLIEAGVIDPAAFAAALASGGHPLTSDQRALLEQGGDGPVILDAGSAHFLLDFLWAVGLANQNPLLLQGEMQQDGSDQMLNYASTAGWTLAARPVAELYAALPLTRLTPIQQQRLEQVAAAAYRPCCNNPTSFPDCNHGMALLGLLELMAAQDASADAMFDAAKYVNAFWFPDQMQDAATFVKLKDGQDFTHADARTLVGSALFSSAGAATTHRWLVENGYLPTQEGQGASCGV